MVDDKRLRFTQADGMAGFTFGDINFFKGQNIRNMGRSVGLKYIETKFVSMYILYKNEIIF